MPEENPRSRAASMVPYMNSATTVSEYRDLDHELTHRTDAPLSSQAWDAWENEQRRAISGYKDTLQQSGLNKFLPKNIAPGPALAILLDYEVPNLSGTELDERLEQIIAAYSTSTARTATAAGVAATATLGIAAVLMLALPVWALLASALVALVAIALGMRRPLPNGGGHMWHAVTYRPISLEVAREFAQAAVIRREEIQRRRAEANGGEEPAAFRPATPSPQQRAAALQAQLDAARTVLQQLDAEWLEFITDRSAEGLRAFYFEMPALWRRPAAEPVRRYELALEELREFVNSSVTNDEADGGRAHALAERALSAWTTAQQYALTVGVDDGRSPEELSAARQLPELIAQFVDPTTAPATADRLKVLIEQRLDRLTTRPAQRHIDAINGAARELHRPVLKPALTSGLTPRPHAGAARSEPPVQ